MFLVPGMRLQVGEMEPSLQLATLSWVQPVLAFSSSLALTVGSLLPAEPRRRRVRKAGSL